MSFMVHVNIYFYVFVFVYYICQLKNPGFLNSETP